ncbi:MAG: hypothetical protein ABH821_06095 [archaeon]
MLFKEGTSKKLNLILSFHRTILLEIILFTEGFYMCYPELSSFFVFLFHCLTIIVFENSIWLRLCLGLLLRFSAVAFSNSLQARTI